MSERVPARRVFLGLLALLMLTSVGFAGLRFGTIDLTFGDIWDVFLYRTGVTPSVDPMFDRVIWQLRLPRVLLAGAVGAGLSVVGVAMQTLVRNPLAEPYILGVSSGASAGAAVLYLGFLPAGAAGFITLPLAAFLGSLLALGLAYGVARVGPVLSTTRLLLAGVAIAALLSAITSFLIFASPQPEKLQTLLFWLLGSFSSARWEFVPLPLICTVLGASVLTLWARPLDALLVGEEPAQSLGIPVETLKRLLIAGTALLTGVAVASAGVIGFVGLIVPHATRFLVGVTHRRLVPSAALGGAVFLILADVVARTLLAGRELPIGIITAVCGVPFFLLLLRSRLP